MIVIRFFYRLTVPKEGIKSVSDELHVDAVLKYQIRQLYQS